MKSSDCWLLFLEMTHFSPRLHVCSCINLFLSCFWILVFSFWFVSGSFTLIHVIYQSSALSLSFWTGKKQGAPENRNKGNPPLPSPPIQRQVLESRVNLTHSPHSSFLSVSSFFSLYYSHAVASTLFLLNLWELLSPSLYLWKSATLICCSRAKPYPALQPTNKTQNRVTNILISTAVKWFRMEVNLPLKAYCLTENPCESSHVIGKYVAKEALALLFLGAEHWSLNIISLMVVCRILFPLLWCQHGKQPLTYCWNNKTTAASNKFAPSVILDGVFL